MDDDEEGGESLLFLLPFTIFVQIVVYVKG